MKFNRIILSAVAAAAVAVPVAVSAPANAAGTPGCVTRAENSRLWHDMSRTDFARVTGTYGVVTGHRYYYSTGAEWWVVSARKCTGGNLTEGFANFESVNGHWRFFNGPRLTDKDRW
jgi:Ni/Co efflux regulator RcnB